MSEQTPETGVGDTIVPEVRGKYPIDRPCSVCSDGDTEMEYHDHHAPFRQGYGPGLKERDIEPETLTEPLIICAFDCTEQDVKKCRKCNRPFCIIHCNNFSPNFCKDCFKDITVVADKFKRTFDHIADNGQMYVKVEERLRYYLDGVDWPFVMPWINSLSDDDLKIVWVFHHSIMRMIEVENDTRNIEKNRVLRETRVPRLMTVAGTGSSATKRVTKIIQPETPEQLRAKFTKMGLPANVIDQMIAAMATGGQP